jgi:hypothetical protein
VLYIESVRISAVGRRTVQIKKFLHPRREERCRRIKHTMRKLDVKIKRGVEKKKLDLRKGKFDEGTAVFL